MNVIDQPAQSLAGFNQKRLEPPLEQMPVFFSIPVKTCREGRLHPTHALREVALRRSQTQVKVIGQNTVREQPPRISPTGLVQCLLKTELRPFARKNERAVISTVDHVVNVIAALDPRFP